MHHNGNAIARREEREGRQQQGEMFRFKIFAFSFATVVSRSQDFGAGLLSVAGKR